MAYTLKSKWQRLMP